MSDADRVLLTQLLAERSALLANALGAADIPPDARTALAMFEMSLSMMVVLGAPWADVRERFETFSRMAGRGR